MPVNCYWSADKIWFCLNKAVYYTLVFLQFIFNLSFYFYQHLSLHDSKFFLEVEAYKNSNCWMHIQKYFGCQFYRHHIRFSPLGISRIARFASKSFIDCSVIACWRGSFQKFNYLIWILKNLNIWRKSDLTLADICYHEWLHPSPAITRIEIVHAV